MKPGGFPWTLQFSYLLLYGLGIVAALWQRGHTLMCLAVLAALVPLGLIARIPEKWFPEWARQSFQLILAGCGMGWWQYRLAEVPIDLMLVEGTVILGTSLIVGGIRREYATLSTISLLLVGYGGLSPGRAVYVPVFFSYCFLGILLMYQTRTVRLLGAEPPQGTPEPKGSAWFYRILHFAFVGAFLFVFVTSCPMPQGRSPGIVPVSYRTTQDLQFPALWRHWFQPVKTVLIKETGTATTDAGKDPDVLSKTAKKRAQAKKPDGFESVEGKGGAGVGTDLVFRVYSPAKLYWLARLYDIYDGKTWSISETMRRGRGGLDTVHLKSGQQVEQFFSVERVVSRYLCGAYRSQNFTYRPPPVISGSGEGKGPPQHIVLRHHIAGAMAQDDPPDPPWGYTCTSSVPTVDTALNVAPWESYEHRGWNYRQLPVDRISKRVRDLALSVTAPYDTPMQKAIALRDFLRGSYTYSLEPPPAPENAEIVDFFLFESKRGYCQHFAQALTVLARVAGLQARLATGYSPGNYNLLGKCFEVYEYHAHAWTQIFIEPFGWLTFDGSPPGNLRLETTPSFLRHLGDPFGDQWSSHPPELSISAPPKPKPVESTGAVTEQPRDGNVFSRAYQDVYDTAVSKSGSLKPGPRAIAEALGAKSKEWGKMLWSKLKVAAVEWLTGIWRRLSGQAGSGANWLKERPASQYLAVGGVAVALFLLNRRRHRLAAMLHRWYLRYNCNRLWHRLNAGVLESPEVRVRHSFELCRYMLGMVECRRTGNMDLMEFADGLAEHSPALGQPLQQVFGLFCLFRFADLMPDRDQALGAVAATGQVRNIVLKHLSSAADKHSPFRLQSPEAQPVRTQQDEPGVLSS